MGCWDIYCPICGCPPRASGILNNYDEMVKRVGKELTKMDCRLLVQRTKWLNKCYFMTVGNKLIKGVQEVGCNVQFGKKGRLYTSVPCEFADDAVNGYFIHADCYQFVMKVYGIELRLGDFYVNLRKGCDRTNLNRMINWKGIKKYQGQYMDMIGMYQSGDAWMLESPLKNRQNANRIKHVFLQWKIRSGRSGPFVSASFYPNGTYKMGSDGYIWVVRGSRWVKVNKKPMKETVPYQSSLLKKIPAISFSSKEPCFITCFDKKTVTLVYLL